MPKKKPKKSPGSGWNEESYQQRIQSLEEMIQQQKEALERARPLLQENNRLRAKLRAGEGAAEIITEILSGLIMERPTLIEAKSPPILNPKLYRPDEENVAVAHVCDLHVGKISPTYDTKIAAARLREYGRKVTRCLRVHHASQGIQDLRVYLGGDMVEGEAIFPHQAHEIDSSVFEQACFAVPEVLAEVIAGWSANFKRVKVCCAPGNHGRNGPKGTSASKKTNWDMVTYRVLSLLLKHLPNVEMQVANTFYIVDEVLGKGNLLVHGDTVRGGFAGFPWYGVGRKAAGWIDSIPEPWQNLFLGHFHTPVSGRFNGRWWFCNGSTESDNDYARSEMASMGTPGQRLVIFNRKHGPIVDLLINLTEGMK